MKNKHLYRDTKKDTYMPDRTGAALAQALNALEKLAHLGNGDQYGNSLGNMIARDALTAAEAALAEPQEPVVPAGYELLACKGLHALVEALDRAERKGYMPDAVAVEWEAFEYRDMLAATNTAPARAEPTASEIDKTIRSHGTGGWQTFEDMRKFAYAILALRSGSSTAQNNTNG